MNPEQCERPKSRYVNVLKRRRDVLVGKYHRHFPNYHAPSKWMVTLASCSEICFARTLDMQHLNSYQNFMKLYTHCY